MAINKTRHSLSKRIKNAHPAIGEAISIIMLVFGAFLVAFGLEFFLVPLNFIDGGVTGISIMASKLLNLPLGLFIALLNLPFVVLAWKFSGHKNAIRTIIGVASLAGFTLLFHHREPLTQEFVLALGYGGVLLGVGVGLALRYGGALDGIESLAHFLSQRTRFDVDKIILIANFFIFIAAAFIYTPEQAMASFLLFYIVVAPMIKRIVDGGSEIKAVQIISTQHAAIGEAIHKHLEREVIFVDAHRDELKNDLKIVSTFINRIEESILVEAVEAIDENAVIIFHEASSVRSGLLSTPHH